MNFRLLPPLLASLLLAACTAAPKPPKATVEPTVAVDRLPPLKSRVAGLVRREGLLPTYLDAQRGRLWLELPAASATSGFVGEYLLVEALATGLGNDAIGLDRGAAHSGRLVRLRRSGGKLLIEALNTGFRASGEAEAVRAAHQGFPTAVLWAGELAAEDADGRALVDLTSFALGDRYGVAAALRAAGQGEFVLDLKRSALEPSGCLAFAENLELEATLTFGASDAGREVRAVAAVADSLSFGQRLSLLHLPAPGYRPRRDDPRMGSISIGFLDLGAPLAAPLATRWAVRHRLEKVDPAAERSPVKRPIVYYVDRAAPEPARQAILDGARFWTRAFEAAGLLDAFRVELLPEGVDPLDARYNVILWVHRKSRGWSYGGGVVDPRTGEVVRGAIALDSQRLRYDRLLFEGLVGADRVGEGGANDPLEAALARLRQLAAHEVGHALGLEHNFAASTYGGRASVMDYPAPFVRVTEGGGFDLSRAYADGLGDWDLAAIRYLYSEWPSADEESVGLAAIVSDALARELFFVADRDARPMSAAQPRGSLWDNGSDPVTELERTVTIRRLALARFGERNVPLGAPLADLEQRLAPVYFLTRYQIAAAAKLVGGIDFRYAQRGDGQPVARRPPPEEQRRAWEAILAAIRPAELDLSDGLLRLLVGSESAALEEEGFARLSTPAFDLLSAARSLADLAFAALLEPARAERLIDGHRRNADYPGFTELLDRLIDAVFVDSAALEPRHAEIARAVQRVLAERLMGLAAATGESAGVRSRVEAALASLLQRLDRIEPLDADEKAHFASLSADIGRFLARPATAQPLRLPAPRSPRGEPLGERLEWSAPGPGFCARQP